MGQVKGNPGTTKAAMNQYRQNYGGNKNSTQPIDFQALANMFMRPGPSQATPAPVAPPAPAGPRYENAAGVMPWALK
jgi:hypothetical protein